MAALLSTVWTSPPSAAQSVEDCQTASKYHAEAEVIQELFNDHWKATKADGHPALRADEKGGQQSLQRRVSGGLSGCMSSGGSSDTCGNYKRIRDAWIGDRPTAGNVSAQMYTDPYDCTVYDAKSNQEIDPTTDRPADGYAAVAWDAMYKHERFHSQRCRSVNEPGKEYDADSPSPYVQRMEDPRLLAEEEIFAYEVTQGVLEKYLEDNCFDPTLQLEASMGEGQCGEGAEGLAKLTSLAGEAKDWVVNTASDWLDVGSSGPVGTPANGEKSVQLRGSCQCCDGTTKNGEVRVYGGPGHSILVAKDPVSMKCAKSKRCGGMSGDPHMHTFDGLRYDFMGAGEFVLARSEGFELQARMEPVGDRAVTIASAAAARVGPVRVAFHIDEPLRVTVDGLPAILEVGARLPLPGGGALDREDLRYRIVAPQGQVVEIRDWSSYISLRFGTPRDITCTGLLGTFDGDRSNDLVPDGAAALPQPVDFESLYKVFGASWRVTAATSLFDYGEGQSPDTFHNTAFPPSQARTADFTPEQLRRAQRICREAGVRGAVNIQDCVLDVGLTDDPQFAKAAAEMPQTGVRLAIRNGPSGSPPTQAVQHTQAEGVVRIEAPSQAFAAADVKVRLIGPAEPGFLLGFAPLGSGNEGKAENPYSARFIKAGQEDYALVVPTVPGEYELRYRQNRGERLILARVPFNVGVPNVLLKAPPSAAAEGPLTVRASGDISTHMMVTVVEQGAPDTKVGPGGVRRSLRNQPEFDAKLTQLPTEPGQYEIRCISDWNGGRTVYARRPLTVH